MPISSAARARTRTSKSQGTIHLVTVAGTYCATGGEGGKLLTKPYEIQFRIKDSEHQRHGALSVFKHHIAPKVLKFRDPSYVNVLTHEIKHTETPGRDLPSDIRLMNRTQLLMYIEQQDYEVTSKYYSDTAQLQTAVMEYEADPAAFLKGQERIEKRLAKGADTDALYELNADLFEKGMFDGLDYNDMNTQFDAATVISTPQEDAPNKNVTSAVPTSTAKPRKLKTTGTVADDLDI